MNVLVLGGTQFMGVHLVKSLISQGYALTIATRGTTQDPFGNKVTRIIIERSSLESLQKNIPPVKYDIVFDSLAYCSNDVKYLLDTVQCKKYIQTSSASVYSKIHIDTKEAEFDPSQKELVYCNRKDFPYNEIKRQAECAIVQDYPHISSTRVRFPFVIGEDDYTKRLFFYVEHTINQKPMFINNLDAQLSFVRSDEAGQFLAFLAKHTVDGAINAASQQTIRIADILEYVKTQTGKSAILADDGEAAPYNGAREFSLNTDKAKNLGFSFTPLLDWIYTLIDTYIIQATTQA